MKTKIMDSMNINAENSDLVQNDSNLRSLFITDVAEKQYFGEKAVADGQGQDQNKEFISMLGDKSISPALKRKLQKFKVSSTVGDIGSPCVLSPLLKFNKRKFLNASEIISGEADEFNGFDLREPEVFKFGNLVLKKLIAETEMISNIPAKNRNLAISTWQNLNDVDLIIKENDESTTDSEDRKNIIESDVCNITADESSTKSEKSANSSISFDSIRSKRSRSSRGTSPGSGARQKVSIDINNSTYKEPFKYGWKRELVYRAGASEHQTRRMADIYYYTPEGKKVRSYREVIEFLTSSELTIDNFTFFKEPLGVNDPNKEIIRDAKKARDTLHNNKSVKKLSKKNVEIFSVKKVSPKKVVNKFGTLMASTKSAKTSTTFKVKLPSKKTSYKKEILVPFTSKPNETCLPLQRILPIARKNQNMEDESPTGKIKRLAKQNQPDQDRRHFFMVSICMGYHALARIFQYLKVQELLRAARVCRMWRDLAAHPSLWKTVRMKNSQVTDWDGLADTLKNRGTQHLDLRKMLIVGEADTVWKKFVAVIPKVSSLVRLELCRCPAIVVEEVMKNCAQLRALSAMSIKCDSLNLESVSNLNQCNELKLKAISGMALSGDLMPLLNLQKLTHLSLTSIKDLGKKKIETLHTLRNLETLELGECSDLPDRFGTLTLTRLQNLERLRLEKGQGSCCTFDILDGVSRLKNLTQLELVNFDVKNGFNKYLATCKHIKRLLIIPTYVSQSATSNNMILGGVTELSHNLTHFVWGVTQELLRVTELFVDQCNQMSKQIIGDSIPVLKPVPCLNLIEDVLGNKDDGKDDKQQSSNLSNPQVQILPLPHLQKLLLTALPRTRVKILKIPFHATWRQSISDSAS